MPKVKLFQGHCVVVESEINAWLKEHIHNLIKDIQLTSIANGGVIVLIFYETTFKET